MRRSAIRLGVGAAVAVAALAIGAGPAVADRGASGTSVPGATERQCWDRLRGG
jgi:hypothetical protein